MKRISYLILIICALCACKYNKVYDSFAHTPLTGWDKNDSVVFNIDRMKAASNYNFNMNVRTNNSFPFTSAVLIVNRTIIPVDKEIMCKTIADTVVCQFSDKKGNNKGDGINIYQYTFALKHLYLNEGDSMHISVHHNMKREMLPGISDIGIEIERLSE